MCLCFVLHSPDINIGLMCRTYKFMESIFMLKRISRKGEVGEKKKKHKQIPYIIYVTDMKSELLAGYFCHIPNILYFWA